MPDDPEHDQLPQKLAADLHSLYEPPFKVPAAMSEAILNRSRARLAGRSRGRRLRWLGGAAAAAACLLLVARLALRPADSVQPAARVTIVDALILAKQIEAGKGRDINGDGIIDKRDVDTIAMAAVKLEDRGGVQ